MHSDAHRPEHDPPLWPFDAYESTILAIMALSLLIYAMIYNWS